MIIHTLRCATAIQVQRRVWSCFSMLQFFAIISLTYDHNPSQCDQNGWGNSRGDNSVITQNQGCHQLLFDTSERTFSIGI